MSFKFNDCIYIFTRTPWSEPERARHQVAKALSEYTNVIFIEANKIGRPRIEIKIISNNLYLLTPYWPIDYRLRFRLPLMNELFQIWLISRIRRTSGSLRVRLVNFDHTAYLMQSKLGYKPIYYCNDNHVRSYGIPLIKYYFRLTETFLSKKSSLNICTTKWLHNKIKKYNPNTIAVSLGAITPLIQPTFKIANSPIKVLLLGFISENKVPIEALFKILEHDDIEFTIVGPVSNMISKRLKPYMNYKERGVLKGTLLESAISETDVCIAVYDPDKINEGVSPNKLWQYLAFGKPVVVTKIPNIGQNEYDDKLVYVTTNDDLVNNIYKAAKENSYDLYLRRIELASDNSWQKKVKIIMNHFYDITKT